MRDLGIQNSKGVTQERKRTHNTESISIQRKRGIIEWSPSMEKRERRRKKKEERRRRSSSRRRRRDRRLCWQSAGCCFNWAQILFRCVLLLPFFFFFWGTCLLRFFFFSLQIPLFKIWNYQISFRSLFFFVLFHFF